MANQSTPVLIKSLTLTGTVTANTFVQIDGTAAGAGENALGVAQTGGSSGAIVPVVVLGTACVLSGAAVTKGDTLKIDSAGKAITWASSGAKVALALEAATDAGQLIEVFLIPNVA